MPLGIGSSSHDHLLLIHLLRHRAFRMFETTMYYATDQWWDCIELYREKKHKRRKLIIQPRLGLAPFLLLLRQLNDDKAVQTHITKNPVKKQVDGQAFFFFSSRSTPNGQNFQSCFFGTEGKVRRRRRLGRTGLLGVFISFASFSAENFQVVLIFDLFFPYRKLENQLYWKADRQLSHSHFATSLKVKPRFRKPMF